MTLYKVVIVLSVEHKWHSVVESFHKSKQYNLRDLNDAVVSPSWYFVLDFGVPSQHFTCLQGLSPKLCDGLKLDFGQCCFGNCWTNLWRNAGLLLSVWPCLLRWWICWSQAFLGHMISTGLTCWLYPWHGTTELPDESDANRGFLPFYSFILVL